MKVYSHSTAYSPEAAAYRGSLNLLLDNLSEEATEKFARDYDQVVRCLLTFVERPNASFQDQANATPRKLQILAMVRTLFTKLKGDIWEYYAQKPAVMYESIMMQLRSPSTEPPILKAYLALLVPFLSSVGGVDMTLIVRCVKAFSNTFGLMGLRGMNLVQRSKIEALLDLLEFCYRLPLTHWPSDSLDQWGKFLYELTINAEGTFNPGNNSRNSGSSSSSNNKNNNSSRILRSA